ncbi:uncharacterized protein LOC119589198 isoform X1 [Penaeus monodon]|uniref:uncharacterized protein LOC119589198 isoform X1 n=1 Tax=Penaeus monodon TaxID=6687 RepID=UPI0018A77D9A|nr:uncharacterized protein LOC119589198 isoform X1 [Penaeus monodon]
MKVTLIMVLMAVVGLSSAYSRGDVYEKPQRVERAISAGSTRMIGGERDISEESGSMSMERIKKRDTSGESSSLESRERGDAFAVSHDLDLRRLWRSDSFHSSESNSIEN